MRDDQVASAKQVLEKHDGAEIDIKPQVGITAVAFGL